MRASQAQQKYKLAYNFPTFFLQIVENNGNFWKELFQDDIDNQNIVEK